MVSRLTLFLMKISSTQLGYDLLFPRESVYLCPMYQFISSLQLLWIGLLPSPALSLFPCISGLANTTITHSQSSTNITIFIVSRNDKLDSNEKKNVY